jgi:hypothetical protein
MDDIVQNIRTKAKHKAHTEPDDNCPLCASEMVIDDNEDLLGLLDDDAEEVEAPSPDKKASRLARIMGPR